MVENKPMKTQEKDAIAPEYPPKKLDWEIDWTVPIEQKFVNYTLRILKLSPQERSLETTIDRSIDLGTYDGKRELNDVYIIYSSKKAVKFADIKPLRLYYNSYIIRFMIPNKHVVNYESDRPGTEQKIEITNWSYLNCYYWSIQKILEDFGKFIVGLRYCNSESPSVKFSSYSNFLSVLEVKEAIKELKEKGGQNK